MKIIIAGAGKTGRTLAEILVSEGHDITIIENDSKAITEISNALDVICVEGNASNPEILSEAGAAYADLMVAATEKDEVNMVCGIAAGKLGTKNVVARIRDIEYLSQRKFLRDAFGLSLIINPELECAKEISRILRMPGADRIEAFPGSNAEIAEFKFEPESMLNGIKISELPSKSGADVLIAAVERDGSVIIPDGSEVITSSDRISVIGSAPEMRKFFIAAGEYRKPSKNVIIIGGGRTSVYLAKLLRENDMKTTIIEVDRECCEQIAEELPDTAIICGDASSSDILAESGIDRADAFVALTGDDGENIVTSMYAQSRRIAKVVTKVDRAHYLSMLESSQLESMVTPRMIIAEQIAKYVRALAGASEYGMEAMYRIANGKAEAVEFAMTAKNGCIGTPLEKLKIRQGVIVGMIIRNGRIIIPHGSDELKEGDHAVFITKPGLIRKPADISEGSV